VLRFGGRVHEPLDTIDIDYEAAEGVRVVFAMTHEVESFGSRPAGRVVARKLRNLAEMCPGQKIFVDFDEVPMISSSFADEVFGRLFVEMGAMAFSQRFEFTNTTDTIRALIDRAIAQRLASG
jgi:hypothetical protein